MQSFRITNSRFVNMILALAVILAGVGITGIQPASAATSMTQPASSVAVNSSTFTDICAGSCDVTGYTTETLKTTIELVNAGSGYIKLGSTTGATSAPTGYTTAEWTANDSTKLGFIANLNDTNAILETLQFKSLTAGATSSVKITTQVDVADEAYLPATGHFYEEVTSVSNITWEDARCKAKWGTAAFYSASSINADKCEGSTERRTKYGLNGYLVNVTSLEEQQALTQYMSSNTVGWMGGSDSQTEGLWRWMDGPEAGTVFYVQSVISGNAAYDGYSLSTARRGTNAIPNGGTTANQFNFFSEGEPNDHNAGVPGEDFAEWGYGNPGTAEYVDGWNDCGSNCVRTNYVVEYGGDGGSLAGLATATVSVTSPGVPSALSAITVKPGDAAMNLSWSAPANGGAPITDYEVQYSAVSMPMTATRNWQTFTDGLTNAATARVTGLANPMTNGDTRNTSAAYVFRVRAINSVGAGAWYETPTSSTTVPGAEGSNAIIGDPGCTANNLPRNDDNSVPSVPLGFDVNWYGSTFNQVAFNNNGGVRFQNAASGWGIFSGLDLASANNEPLIVTLFTDLDTRNPATTVATYGPLEHTINGYTGYCFNWVNIGDYSVGSPSKSAQLILLHKADNNVDIIINYNRHDSGYRTVITGWAAPGGKGYIFSSPVPASGSSAQQGTLATSLVGSKNIPTNYASYDNAGRYIFELSEAGALAAPGAPTAPQNLSVTSVGSGAVDLSWNPPASNGGNAITNYTVEYSTNQTAWSTAARSASTTTTQRVTGLTNGTPYYFRVTAFSNVSGAASEAVGPATPVAGPENTVTPAISGTRTYLQTLTGSDGTWNNNGSTITATAYQWQVSSTSTGTFTDIADATSSTFTISDSAYVGKYLRLKVTKTNGNGSNSAYSAVTAAIAGTPAGTPTIGTAVEASQQVSVPVTAPADLGGSTITGYKYSVDGGQTWSSTVQLVDGNLVIGSLTNGTTYSVAIRAVTQHGGDGNETGLFSVTPFGAPGAPVDIEVSLVGAALDIFVDWVAPAVTGGFAITDYIVQYSGDDGATWLTFNDGVSTETSATVTGLDRAVNYIFRVQAKTSKAESATSARTDKIKRGQKPASLPLTAPTLSFTLPTNSAITAVNSTLVGAKVVNPPAGIPSVEVIRDLTSATGAGLKITDRAVIETGSQARAAIIVDSATAAGKVAAGFIRIGTANWVYLGNKDLVQNADGSFTASTDAMAFAAPTDPGAEYVLVVAVVDSSFGEADFLNHASLATQMLQRARVLPFAPLAPQAVAPTSIRTAAVDNTNVTTLGYANIVMTVEVTGTATATVDPNAGGGSGGNPTPTPTPSPTVTPTPQPTNSGTPSPNSGEGSESVDSGNGSSGSGSGTGAGSGSGEGTSTEEPNNTDGQTPASPETPEGEPQAEGNTPGNSGVLGAITGVVGASAVAVIVVFVAAVALAIVLAGRKRKRNQVVRTDFDEKGSK